MVEVICDTSFLIHLVTKRIKNISSIENEIGSVKFIVPDIVINELKQLSQENSKKKEALATLEYCNNLEKIPISGRVADDALVKHVKKNGGIVGTMDKELKNKIKQSGGSIISFSNDRMVVEG